MKIKVESINHQSIIPAIVASIVFIVVPIAIIGSVILPVDELNFTNLLLNLGFTKLFAVVFSLILGIYLSCNMLNKPKEYSATLIEKEAIDTGTEKYDYIKFKADTEEGIIAIPIEYEGYIYEDNNLEIGNKYLIGIKEGSWKIKYITDYNPTNAIIKKASMKLTFLVMAIFFYCLSLDFLIAGIIIAIEHGIRKAIIYFIIGIIIGSITAFLHTYLSKQSKNKKQ